MWHLEAAALAALVGAVAGLGIPLLIGRIPEPQPAAAAAEADAPVAAPRPAPRPEKEPYAAIAALPGLRWKAAAASATVAALLAARTGLTWGLLPLLYLVPVGVALALVDWRTRLLPTRLIAPSYVVVVLLCLLAALVSGETADLVRAGWGWLVAGGIFLLLWLVHPRGMGYGDVRLSGVLGIALGQLGWGELLVGIWAGFLLGGVAGGILAALRVVDRKGYPFGPFMLLGGVIGVVWGGPLAEAYSGGL